MEKTIDDLWKPWQRMGWVYRQTQTIYFHKVLQTFKIRLKLQKFYENCNYMYEMFWFQKHLALISIYLHACTKTIWQASIQTEFQLVIWNKLSNIFLSTKIRVTKFRLLIRKTGPFHVLIIKVTPELVDTRNQTTWQQYDKGWCYKLITLWYHLFFSNNALFLWAQAKN